MNSGRYVLSQILDLVHWQTLSRLVGRYDAESRVRHFGCRQQLICMAFAQLTWREGQHDVLWLDELISEPGTLQLLSVHPFEKVPLHELLKESDFKTLEPLDSNQMMLWNL